MSTLDVGSSNNSYPTSTGSGTSLNPLSGDPSNLLMTSYSDPTYTYGPYTVGTSITSSLSNPWTYYYYAYDANQPYYKFTTTLTDSSQYIIYALLIGSDGNVSVAGTGAPGKGMTNIQQVALKNSTYWGHLCSTSSSTLDTDSSDWANMSYEDDKIKCPNGLMPVTTDGGEGGGGTGVNGYGGHGYPFGGIGGCNFGNGPYDNWSGCYNTTLQSPPIPWCVWWTNTTQPTTSPTGAYTSQGTYILSTLLPDGTTITSTSLSEGQNGEVASVMFMVFDAGTAQIPT